MSKFLEYHHKQATIFSAIWRFRKKIFFASILALLLLAIVGAGHWLAVRIDLLDRQRRCCQFSYTSSQLLFERKDGLVTTHAAASLPCEDTLAERCMPWMFILEATAKLNSGGSDFTPLFLHELKIGKDQSVLVKFLSNMPFNPPFQIAVMQKASLFDDPILLKVDYFYDPKIAAILNDPPDTIRLFAGKVDTTHADSFEILIQLGNDFSRLHCQIVSPQRKDLPTVCRISLLDGSE